MNSIVRNPYKKINLKKYIYVDITIASGNNIVYIPQTKRHPIKCKTNQLDNQ